MIVLMCDVRELSLSYIQSWGRVLVVSALIALATGIPISNPTSSPLPHSYTINPNTMADPAQQLQTLSDEFQAIGKGAVGFLGWFRERSTDSGP